MKGLSYNLIALAVLALAMTPSLAFGQNNTGTSGGTACTSFVLDPYYALVAAPFGVPLTAYPTAKFPGWVTPFLGSCWINPYGDSTVPAPSGSYDYQTMFTLPTPLPTVLNIEGAFAADNDAQLRANGTFVAATTGGVKGFTHYTHFFIPKGDLATGSNTLDFVVDNDPLSSPGPTGLTATFYCPPSLGPSATFNGLYTDGPANASLNAWTINFGFIVSDSFVVSSSGPVTGFCFFAWVNPTDIPNTVEWSIGSSAFGSDISAGTAPLACALYCQANTWIGPGNGYVPPSRKCGFSPPFSTDIYACTASMAGGIATAGNTYWFTLANATTTQGGPVYWDQNGGPSMAEENTIGAIPAESFILYGPFPI
jgi:hypothetical protein